MRPILVFFFALHASSSSRRLPRSLLIGSSWLQSVYFSLHSVIYARASRVTSLSIVLSETHTSTTTHLLTYCSASMRNFYLFIFPHCQLPKKEKKKKNSEYINVRVVDLFYKFWCPNRSMLTKGGSLSMILDVWEV